MKILLHNFPQILRYSTVAKTVPSYRSSRKNDAWRPAIGAHPTEYHFLYGEYQILWLQNPGLGAGRVGIGILPGNKAYSRNHCLDLERINRAGISYIACLLPETEMHEKSAPDLLRLYEAKGICVKHTPILSRRTPAQEEMAELINWILARLREGHDVLIHCSLAISRSSLVLACMLKACGHSIGDSITQVRQLRGKFALQGATHINFLRNYSHQNN